MNSLAYALLSMLVRKPCSGYELAEMLEVFWQAKHSQIYPLLAKLEQEGYLTPENIEQIGRPNKKLYHITEEGKAKLKKWLSKSPANPVSRDEFLIKAYSLSLTDMNTARNLFEDRMAFYEDKLQRREEMIEQMQAEYGDQLYNQELPVFGRYIVHTRKKLLETQEIQWCEWVINMLK
ncbi:DNA-binding PadR family transcriptional regulator [Paenibacillus shirakamiensis]|uniref:DNA-binding PadR family transcriptional regulator n=1 Tax=Paenibacillus shirakamiensis TaxID=1265935 RepID=A0ABS4JH37_9BACL|nr:PadR family transcriptional regulator [Paenibacillus shirakamiensis]MBP1999874.1 DNA-binding PadR family transcriptional regulator [Paenibacillus shirakamiensis]